MTEDQRLWIEAAKLVDCDPEDHEDDEIIQSVFDKLKRLVEQQRLEARIDELEKIWTRWSKGPDHEFSHWMHSRKMKHKSQLTNLQNKEES